MNRRFFLLAAPAIVAAPSLMKVSALVMPDKPVIFFDEPAVSSLLRRLNEIACAQDMALAEICGVPNILRGTQSA